jgi:hypothetical protein
MLDFHRTFGLFLKSSFENEFTVFIIQANICSDGETEVYTTY